MRRRLAGSLLKRAAARSPDAGCRSRWLRLRRALAVAVLGCLLLWAPREILAQSPGRVVLLDRADSDELGQELSARVRGELRAAGFEVLVLALSPDAAPRDAIETAARHLEPDAVLAVRRIQDPNAGTALAELWISDGRAPPDGRVIRLTGADESQAIAKFAVQVADLVKARLAVLAVGGALQRPVEPPPLTPAPAPRAPSAGVRWTAGAGLGALADAASGIALLPLLRVGVLLQADGAPVYWEIRATAGAFGTQVKVRDGDLQANIQQSLGTADLVLRFQTPVPLAPALFVGAGALNSAVEGVVREGYRARSERVWSAVGTLGAGVSFEPAAWLRWTIDAQGLAGVPATIVRLDDREQAARGELMLLVSTGLLAAF